MTYSIQDANDTDLPGILAIYNDAVQHTTAIWNETLVDLANRRAWLAERTASGFPVLVAHDAAGEVVGYASYGTWRTIEGFRQTVEHSVYIHPDQRGLLPFYLLLALGIVWLHRANLGRLRAGTESRFGRRRPAGPPAGKGAP